MGVPQDKPVRRFVRWLKDKVENRRSRDGEQDPWWVTLLLDVGRPLVAVLILTMCAPGEHYLAVQAGWSERLAWGMPGTLTAYAGIAAVVATKRPQGAPGRKTAIWGAVVSVSLAMAAQPVAHLYGKPHLTAQTVWLIVIMGVIPAAVFGHLLHMGAATPKAVRPERTRADRKPDKAGPDSGVMSRTDWLKDAGLPVSGLMAAAGLSGPDKPSGPAPVVRVDIEEADTPGHVDLDRLVRAGRRSGLGPDKPVPSLADKQNLSARARVLAQSGQDKDTIKDTLRTEFPDATADAVRKAADRATDKVSAAS